MAPPAASVEELLALAIRHVNAGQRERAGVLCELAATAHPPHPAVQQLLAVLSLQDGDAARALRHTEASLALRPGHAPTLAIAADAWFRLALMKQDARDLEGACLCIHLVAQTALAQRLREHTRALELRIRSSISDAFASNETATAYIERSPAAAGSTSR